MDEIWKDLKININFQVSNLGRVRRKPTYIRTDGRQDTRLRSFYIYRPGKYSSGISTRYYTVNIQGKRYTIHSLVAETFLGPKPPGYIVDHIDGNRKNNSVENLQYSTRGDNIVKSSKIISSTKRGSVYRKRY